MKEHNVLVLNIIISSKSILIRYKIYSNIYLNIKSFQKHIKLSPFSILIARKDSLSRVCL